MSETDMYLKDRHLFVKNHGILLNTRVL